MSVVCTKCGSLDVACEAMVNPIPNGLPTTQMNRLIMRGVILVEMELL